MRGAILGMAILAAGGALAGSGSAHAGSAAIVTTRQPPRVAPPPPRPTVTPPPKFSLPQPVTVKIAKPDYSKRAMALVQQNIALQSALRANQDTGWTPRCKASWSQAKLRRKGCLVSPSDGASVEPPPAVLLTDARLCASAVEGYDCGAVRAARDRASNGAAGRTE